MSLESGDFGVDDFDAEVEVRELTEGFGGVDAVSVAEFLEGIFMHIVPTQVCIALLSTWCILTTIPYHPLVVHT